MTVMMILVMMILMMMSAWSWSSWIMVVTMIMMLIMGLIMMMIALTTTTSARWGMITMIISIDVVVVVSFPAFSSRLHVDLYSGQWETGLFYSLSNKMSCCHISRSLEATRLVLKWPYGSGIWQAHRQQCCRCTCQIPGWPDNINSLRPSDAYMRR